MIGTTSNIFLGYNYRMSDVSAALGINQLKKIKRLINKRNEIAKFYNKHLSKLPLKLPVLTPYSKSTFHLYTIQIVLDEESKIRKRLYEYLKKQGIITNVHYLPVHLHPYYKKLGFKKISIRFQNIMHKVHYLYQFTQVCH